jgi:hypothetical protein
MSNLTMRQLLELMNDKSIEARELLLNLDKSNMAATLDLYTQIKSVSDKVDALQKTFAELEQKLSYDIIPKMFEDIGCESFKRNGKNFFVAARFNARINPLEKEAAYTWLRDNKLGHIIQPNVNVKTLSAQVAEIFRETAKLPPDTCIPVHKQTYTGVREA